MKGAVRVVLAWVAILFAATACILISPLFPWTGHQILHSPTAAAWAQTVGTVLAMLTGASAIAWQVRFESRRERRRDIQRVLDVATEIQEMVSTALIRASDFDALLDGTRTLEELKRQLLEDSTKARWHQLRQLIDATKLETLPGLNLKSAFLQLQYGFGVAQFPHGQLTNDLMNGVDPQLQARREHLRLGLSVLNESLEQINGVTAQLHRDIRQV